MQNKKNINEMFEIDTKGKIKTRLPYVKINNWIKSMNVAEIKKKYFDAQNLFEKLGITFSTYENSDEERLLPFDIIPRIINYKEWQLIEKGIKQRSKALNAFLNDIYNKGAIIKAGIIPENLIYQNPAFEKEMVGINVPGKIYSHIIGTDLVRIEKNKFYALEDNCRTPSGVSYMLENREVMMKLFPNLFQSYKILPIEDYPNMLKDTLQSLAPLKCENEPVIALLTPGIKNSAYYEHSFLSDLMGIELVEGDDLFVKGDFVYMRTTEGPKKIDIIYRSIDDEYLDPLCFNPNSKIGIPGIMNVYRSGGITICSAPGSGIADDKEVYIYVPKMIEFYLGEKPIIDNIETWSCNNPKKINYILENIKDLVIKEVHGSGGYGMLIGPKATKKEIEVFKKRIKENPQNYIAQPTLNLSSVPTVINGKLKDRHVDLRPFCLSGKKTYLAKGGLTRVAMKEGSLIVNSSQGGGVKDTWVLTG